MMPTNATAGLFAQLEPLLSHRAVLITVSKLDDGGLLQVNVLPRQLKGSENQALTTPLSMSGTAPELDAEFVSQLCTFVQMHERLNTNLSAIEKEIAEAEKTARDEADRKRKKTLDNRLKTEEGSKAEEKKEQSVPTTPTLFDSADVSDSKAAPVERPAMKVNAEPVPQQRFDYPD